MERITLGPQIHMSCRPADKLNRCRISIHFTCPARRETATAAALLPLLLERGYEDCPDMTALTKRLASLYGADLSAWGYPYGANHDICVSVTGIKERYAQEGEKLSEEYARLVLGAAFRPYLVNGVFDPESVEIEKTMLRQSLEDELDDKKLYCGRQASREFYGDSPASVRQEGYLEEVDGITPEALTEEYHRMLRESSIELMLIGFDSREAAAVRAAFEAETARIARDPVPPAAFFAMPRQKCVHKSEHFDMVQSKLCMKFTVGRPARPSHLASYRMAVGLFGGTATSRLFVNVREKMNLCYYCSPAFSMSTGCLTVDSGVEPCNAERAEKAILHELAQLCGGPITDEEMEDCRRGMISALDAVEDSLGGIETWYYSEILRGGILNTPQQFREELMAVTKDDVRAVLNSLSLSVSYLLCGNEEEKN